MQQGVGFLKEITNPDVKYFVQRKNMAGIDTNSVRGADWRSNAETLTYNLEELKRFIESRRDKPMEFTHAQSVVYNNLSIEQMHGSQIQQGTINSSQSKTVSSLKKDDLQNLLEVIEKGFQGISLDSEQKEELEIAQQTLKLQMKSSNPKSKLL